jgi:cytochrome c553
MRSQLLSALCLSVLVPLVAGAQDTTAAAGKSVWKGVFTEAQAARGETEQQNNCAACHGTEKYSGDAFNKAWFGRTAFDLFDQIKTTMPDDNPGGLSVQQYTDVVAYIFKINGMPAGTDSLSSDPEALRLIKIEPKPPTDTALRPSIPAAVGVSHRRSLQLRPLYHPHVPRTPTATR